MENSNETGKIVGALLIGAVVGAALGILFAPEKGSETRKKISGKTDDLSDALKEKFNALVEEAKKEMDHARERVNEFAEQFSGK